MKTMLDCCKTGSVTGIIELTRLNLEIYDLLKAPLHFAQVETVRNVKRDAGYDMSHILKYAPAQVEYKNRQRIGK